MKIDDTNMIKVKLQELIAVIEFNSDLSESFINKKTGEIVTISSEAMMMAEDGDTTYPAWLEDDINDAKQYLKHPDDFISIITLFDFDEYQAMEDFALKQNNKKLTEKLLSSLKGRGAFRRFKDAVHLLEVDKAWYQFKDARLKEFAQEWCQENGFGIKEEAS